ncbi:cytochrome C [bacterium endosymbiont of Escarpia laminata]|nr:MAG: cytochrome C [bacterium endosymbiont of Escarpia laminata]
MFAFVPNTTVQAFGVFDRLLMPGDVIEGHAAFEDECEKCHEKLEQKRQSQLCLGCHDHANIASDIKLKEGYHGRKAQPDKVSCKHCHTDHKGRGARVVLFDEGSFLHEAADFKLKGLHKQVPCNSCHEQGKKYLVEFSLCVDCHTEADPHRGGLGEKCDKCHVERGWKHFDFDHNKDTEYKLEGKHQDLKCKLCHPGERYKKTPKECHLCHQINDIHGGQFGEKCKECHTTEKWNEVRFDHDRDTKYKLQYRHRKLACNSCHKGPLYKKKLEKDCYACHRLDDVHRGVNGRECHNCHSIKGWAEIGFDHAKDTKFILDGRHTKLPCEACHTSAQKEKQALETTCIACHADDDVHKEQQGKVCVRCHNTDGWDAKVFFDHDLTRFPLIGQHNALACEECHLSSEYKDEKTECVSCHSGDDSHDGRLSEQCETCHSPNGWTIWMFDHNAQTEFKLEGSHEGLNCHACHREKTSDKKLGQDCYSCHRQQDKHRGAYGRKCKRCHNSDSFSEVKMK